VPNALAHILRAPVGAAAPSRDVAFRLRAQYRILTISLEPNARSTS